MSNYHKNVNLACETLQSSPASATMEVSGAKLHANFLSEISSAISDETSDSNPAVEPENRPRTATLKPLVYRVDEIAQLLAISPRAAYNLCNTTKDFRVVRIGTSIRVNRESFEAWFAAL